MKRSWDKDKKGNGGFHVDFAPSLPLPQRDYHALRLQDQEMEPLSLTTFSFQPLLVTPFLPTLGFLALLSLPSGDLFFLFMDLTSAGHGGSDGLHGYVHSLDDAVSDMKIFLEKVLNENPGLPCFCFGHSTGAAITLKALLDPKVESRIAGAVLTSPAVGVSPSHPILLVLAPIASFLLPTYQCSSAYKKGSPVSRDPEALIAKYSDPLVCTGPLRVRTGYEILKITSYLQQNLRKLRVPFFVLHGTADSVTDPVASQKLYVEASSTDKTMKLYDGFLHDLLFEPERDAITQDIIQWLNSRV
ncbi:Caffeoylshikimate esterase [Glycine soja]